MLIQRLCSSACLEMQWYYSGALAGSACTAPVFLLMQAVVMGTW
jgi:hypothetical protein